MSGIIKKIDLKKVIYYILWALILFYLYEKFAGIHPFGKNSAFYQTGCKATKVKLPKDVIKYDGM